MIESEIDEAWNKNGLDSCSNVANKLQKKLENKCDIAPSTLYNYTRQGRNALYGKPYQSCGTLGSCEYMWCKKLGVENGESIYAYFTDQEEQIKNSLIKKYFGNTTDKQIIVQGMITSGEIKESEAWQILSELTNINENTFLNFLQELQEKIGYQVVRGTQVYRFSDIYPPNTLPPSDDTDQSFDF